MRDSKAGELHLAMVCVAIAHSESPLYSCGYFMLQAPTRASDLKQNHRSSRFTSFLLFNPRHKRLLCVSAVARPCYFSTSLSPQLLPMLWGDSFPVWDRPAISWLFNTGLFSLLVGVGVVEIRLWFD